MLRTIHSALLVFTRARVFSLIFPPSSISFMVSNTLRSSLDSGRYTGAAGFPFA
jgi:hypothetical protein